MLVGKIQKINFSNRIINKDRQDRQYGLYKQNLYFNPQNQFILSFSGASGAHARPLNSLTEETQAFPADIAYRKQLMANAGLPREDYPRLSSILGRQGILGIMREFNEKPEIFSAGINNANVNNGTIRANLHIHTVASDGVLNARELLDKAVEYADKVAAMHPESKHAPFTIAVTDHDTADTARDVVRVIAQDPDKYQNLRVILGIEFTTHHKFLPEIAKTITAPHILVYGIDPNARDFSSFVGQVQSTRRGLSEQMLEEANSVYQQVYHTHENFFSAKEAQAFLKPLRKGIDRYYDHTLTYINLKMMLKEIVLKNPYLAGKLQQWNMHGTPDEMIENMRQFYSTQSPWLNTPMDYIAGFVSKTTGEDIETVKDVINKAPQTVEYKRFQEVSSDVLGKYKSTLTSTRKTMPDIDDIFHGVKRQPNTMIGIAHPLDYVKPIEDRTQVEPFLANLYKRFKEICGDKLKFSETYYQSYTGRAKELSVEDGIKIFLSALSKQYKLLKTGSMDTHRYSLFTRYF